jgi:hypothetical protein
MLSICGTGKMGFVEGTSCKFDPPKFFFFALSGLNPTFLRIRED